MANKKKKEKVKYIDDGHTIADMSNVGGYYNSGSDKGRRKATAREKWRTYWQAVKMMLVPMLVVIGILCVTYLLMYLALK